MSPAEAVMERAEASGIALEARGPRLGVIAPRGCPDDLRRELAASKAAVLAELRWRELSAERPGGIVVDTPDPARRLAALAALAGRRGDAWEG